MSLPFRATALTWNCRLLVSTHTLPRFQTLLTKYTILSLQLSNIEGMETGPGALSYALP
jgi:hypothetical protein